MAKLVRFGVSLDKDLLNEFDKFILQKKYPNRSKALGDLIREALIKTHWEKGKEIAGVITLVYDHHKRELVNQLMDAQHDYQHIVVSSQHIHLDHDNCLEMIAVKGKPQEARELADKLRSAKGVKHGSMIMTTTGKGLK